MYFEVFSVGESMKTRFAALNFKGAAATWLQTFERRGRVLDWEEFCLAVLERFDRDQYQTQLRQLNSLRQTGSVSDTYFIIQLMMIPTLLLGFLMVWLKTSVL